MMMMLKPGRAGAARFLLPIALVAAMGTGSVMAQDQDDEGAGGSDTGSVQGPVGDDQVDTDDGDLVDPDHGAWDEPTPDLPDGPVGDDPVGTDDGGLVDPDHGAGDEPTPDLPDGPVTGDTVVSDDVIGGDEEIVTLPVDDCDDCDLAATGVGVERAESTAQSRSDRSGRSSRGGDDDCMVDGTAIRIAWCINW
jgi:hypothetical protein